jgi:hypothetical protein
MPVFRDYSPTNRTAENGQLGSEWRQCPAFLWRADAQSGFEEHIRRTECDHKRGIQHGELTFLAILESDSGVSYAHPISG